MIIDQGWLVPNTFITHCHSQNCDERPNKNDIRLLVIHHIALPPHQFGTGDVEQFFTNQLDIQKHQFYQTIKDLRVSAHVMIKRNGEIVQFVNFNDRAWHAGKSSYQGCKACNDFSIGIELEGDSLTAYRYGQYAALIELTKALQAEYPNIKENITGHENIAPGRKTDPGPTFDWARYRALL